VVVVQVALAMVVVAVRVVLFRLMHLQFQVQP
jgi:hypothetical protein